MCGDGLAAWVSRSLPRRARDMYAPNFATIAFNISSEFHSSSQLRPRASAFATEAASPSGASGTGSAKAGAPGPNDRDILVGAQAVVHISASKNNTILALQDPHGNKKAGASAGTVGYKKARRSSHVAAADAAASLVQKARDLGIHTVAVKVRGIGAGREASLTALVESGLRLTKIVDATPVPHNGCRPPKKRRV